MKKLTTMLLVTGLLALLTFGGVAYADSGDISSGNGHNALIYHTNGDDGYKLVKVDEHAKKLVYDHTDKKDKDDRDDPTDPSEWQTEDSYQGDCNATPPGTVCVEYSDGYIWLVQDTLIGWDFEGTTIEIAQGYSADYHHTLGTLLVRTVFK